MSITKTTIVFPVKGDFVLLGLKKRGFGANWWNGFGGKLENGETFIKNAERETLEEAAIDIRGLRPVARLLFYFDGVLKIASLALVAESFRGAPAETEEMRPKWFNIADLPFDKMWPGDDTWIPEALELSETAKPIQRKICFTGDNEFLSIEPASDALAQEIFE